MIDHRERDILRLLWTHGRLSRSELHEMTGTAPNGVGVVAGALLKRGLLRECLPDTATSGAGRPRVPLEIDPEKTHMLGLSIAPGRVEVCRLGVSGRPLGKTECREVVEPNRIISRAASLLSRTIRSETIGIGVSAPGFIDIANRSLLTSSVLPGRYRTGLDPIFAAAGNVPILIENDMHALAARWLLGQRRMDIQDALLVLIADGRVGAAMLISGRPNRGCIAGGNELGHTRFFVDTDRCFCGHTGCLERIVSTPFLAKVDGTSKSLPLAERAMLYQGRAQDPAIGQVLTYLGCGLANIINFVRPHRLVLVSALTRFPTFCEELVRLIRGGVLAELADRTRIDYWDEPAAGSAESAAWLAMAELFHGGWTRDETPHPA